MTPAIDISALTLGYGRRDVLHALSLPIPEGRFTALIGPNGCGKSTLLKALTRGLAPRAGEIRVEGTPLGDLPPRQLARRLSFLPQVLPIPEGLSVRELIGHGRSPHNNFWGRMKGSDREAVDSAIARLDLAHIADRPVEALSGGQRQRAWLAMVLAQDTPIVLLDEPTTFLDISHQVEVLRLARTLTAAGRTVVAVLHDLNQAFRYADHVVMLIDGRIATSGTPSQVCTPDNLRNVFGIEASVHTDPEADAPMAVIRRD